MSSEPQRLHVLIYEYVEDILERRGPYREAHLGLARGWRDEGRLLMGGATGDPPTGALFVFDVPEASVIDEFVGADPYVEAGLVIAWRVQPWTVAVRL